MISWFSDLSPVLIFLAVGWCLVDNSRLVSGLTALARTARRELLAIELPVFPELELPRLTRAERRRYLPARHQGERVERIRHRRGWR